MIHNKAFTVEKGLFENRTFTVTSMQRMYDVTWDLALNPCDSINTLLARSPKNLLFIDEKVYQLYGKDIRHAADKIFKAPALETFKTLEGVSLLYEFLYKHSMEKHDTLIVVGGGIIQDVAAFACSTYKRGIHWIHFPTTLLSMSDSCIGGKAGLNYQSAKNQLAIISAPHEVIINPIFLHTLDKRDIRSGLGEILKSSILGGASLLEDYKRCISQQSTLTDRMTPSKHIHIKPLEMKQLIANALSLKKVVIEHDEFEKDIRKALNYGHTLGHVIESLSDYSIAHGTAVVVGMMLVNRIHYVNGELGLKPYTEINELCMQLLDDETLYCLMTMDTSALLRILKEDKKVVQNAVTFVMLSSVGYVEFVKKELNDALCLQIQTAFSYLFVN